MSLRRAGEARPRRRTDPGLQDEMIGGNSDISFVTISPRTVLDICRYTYIYVYIHVYIHIHIYTNIIYIRSSIL